MNYNLELNADLIDVKLKTSGEIEFKLATPMTTDLWMFLGRNNNQTVNIGMSSSQLEFVAIGNDSVPATQLDMEEARDRILAESAPPVQEKVKRGRKPKVEVSNSPTIMETIQAEKVEITDDDLEDLESIESVDPDRITDEDLAELENT